MSSLTVIDRATKLHQLEQHLRLAYGEPQWQPGVDPVDELVNTILSQPPRTSIGIEGLPP